MAPARRKRCDRSMNRLTSTSATDGASEALLDCPIVIGQYDNVPESATLNPPIDEHLLDELVPPPGPLWRRAVLWVAFLGMVGAISWAATSGTVIPQVSTSVMAWGGTGPVGVTSEVMNDSRVAIEVVDGARPRPGLKLMGYTTEPNASSEFAPTESPSDQFPLRLEPDQSVDLTAWYRVTDCQAVEDIDPGDGEIELQVRIADGPAAWFTAGRTIDAKGVEPIDSPQMSWPAGVAYRACAG